MINHDLEMEDSNQSLALLPGAVIPGGPGGVLLDHPPRAAGSTSPVAGSTPAALCCAQLTMFATGGKRLA
jgi:hypothetical protein